GRGAGTAERPGAPGRVADGADDLRGDLPALAEVVPAAGAEDGPGGEAGAAPGARRAGRGLLEFGRGGEGGVEVVLRGAVARRGGGGAGRRRPACRRRGGGGGLGLRHRGDVAKRVEAGVGRGGDQVDRPARLARRLLAGELVVDAV